MPDIVLTLPPSLNHAYITRRGSGQRIMTSKARAWKEAAGWQIKAIIKRPYPKLSLVQYAFFWPDLRVRDVDNALKLIRDALKGTLVDDDSWRHITEECVISRLDRANPRVSITFLEDKTCKKQ